MFDLPFEKTEGAATPAELLQRGFRYALSLAHNAHDAEDLVHEAWLKLTRRYGTVSSRALLYVSIRHVFIDQVRRRGGKEMLPLEELEDQLPGKTAEACGAADLTVLLNTLRPAEREALFLHHVEGYTAEEIARLTGSPRNTVLSLMNRAMKKLHILQKD